MTVVAPIREKELINQIKQVLKAQNYRNYMLFIMGINIGLRISDTLNLKVKDVRNREYIELYEKKTSKYKKIPIIKAYKQDLDNFIKNKNDDDWLFQNQKTCKPITRVQAYRIINKACLEVGIVDNVGTHTLRKTFGYHFYQEYKDIALLQYIFNHSSQRITLMYIGITQEMIEHKLKNFEL